MSQPGDQTAPTNPDSATIAPESATIREAQVQNAVSFLSHEKVRASPVSTKRAFLEKKGLTAGEIDEAFRRVPEPADNLNSGVNATPAKPWAQQPAPTPPSTAAPSGQQSLALTVAQPQAPPASVAQPVRWSQVVLGIGVVAAGAYAVKSYLWPLARDMFAQQRAAQQKRQDEIEQLHRELQQIVQGIQASQAELLKGVQDLTLQLRDQSSRNRDSSRFNDDWRADNRYNAQPTGYGSGGYRAIKETDPFGNTLETDELRRELYQVRSELAKYSANCNAPALVNYPSGSGNGGCHNQATQGPRGYRKGSAPSSYTPPEAHPYSQSFQEVMEMVAKGITPPNVRTDINDQPPDPTRPVTEPKLNPRAKPWERSGPPSSSGSVVEMAVSEPLTQRGPLYTQAQASYNNPMGPGSPWAPPTDPVYSTSTTSYEKAAEVTTTVTSSTWRPPPPPQPTFARQPPPRPAAPESPAGASASGGPTAADAGTAMGSPGMAAAAAAGPSGSMDAPGGGAMPALAGDGGGAVVETVMLDS